MQIRISLVRDTQLYLYELKTRKTRIYDATIGIVCVKVCWRWGWGGVGLRLGVGYPCPPVRNTTVTPRHLLLMVSE